MVTPTTLVRGRRLGKGLATVLATGLLLTACGGDGGGDGGLGPRPPTEPSTRSMEEVEAGSITGWDACEMFGDHVTEFAEFLDYKEFTKDLFSSNGTNSGGVKICTGTAIYYENPDGRAVVRGRVDIGFGTAGLKSTSMQDEEYRTPTGRYDLGLKLMRDYYEEDSLVEREEEGPWTKAVVMLGDGIGTTLSAFILDTERDFMIKLVMEGLDPGRGEVSWTVTEAADHFREVTMVNAYQAMADRYDETH